MNRKRGSCVMALALCACILTGCNVLSAAEQYVENTFGLHDTETVTETVTYRFEDEFHNVYEAEAKAKAKKCEYEKAAYLMKAGRISYEGMGYSYRLGIDVSYYQQEIDWKKVKNDGIDFVFIRLGFRGYEDGGLYMDTKFLEHIEGAKKAGLDVGVYFFAQALNEREAKEEAEYVLKHVRDYDLQMPIAYDVEEITDGDGRMNSVSVKQLTRNAVKFCDTIQKNGYDAMIYCNMYYKAYKLDIEKLNDYSIWYADFNRYPQTPYHYDIWQYTDRGTVDGIEGNVDLNIQMIKEQQ